MKKLMFATALVASVAAFADAAPTAINAINFAGYATGATFQNYDPERNSEENTGPFFYFQGDAGVSNSSVVTNESASANHTAFFADATDSNYLALDTEGGTFWRGLNQAKRTEEGETVTYGLGDPRAVAATGTYLDTLVQFTVTEDDAPTTTADDKLAIWLGVVTNAQGEVTGTNLMVRAKAWVLAGGQPAGSTADFVVANSPVEAGEWYRLTVKAVQTTINPSSGFFIPAFQIYIDGNAVAATTSQISTEAQEAFTSNKLWLEGMASLATANQLFPSLAENIGQLTDVTLQGVGFQGTGAVDEIVWTEDDLFPAGGQTGIDFTLTWGEGVSAVKYVLSTDTATTNALTSGTAVQLTAGDGTATIELIPTFASGYEFDKVTMGETELGLTFAIPSVTTNATLLAKASAPAYPTYLTDADSTIKDKYDAWKVLYGADTESAYETAFLLNMDPATSVAAGTALLKIASITEVATGWELEIVSDATTLTATDGTAQVGNGYLGIKAADTLEGLASATPSYINVTVTNGKITVIVPAVNGKFMKAELTSMQIQAGE